MSSSVKGDPMESGIIEIMRKEDYALETVNNYGDNLLHQSAAKGCYRIIKEILNKKRMNGDENPQNDCGWTPLMLAIRNGNIDSVKLLLANGSNPDQTTFQGISSITLSVAIGRDMFEIVHGACPSALASAKNDVIGPLCVAAMTNDKELFFRLLELGLNVSEAGEITHSMMRRSIIPEIVELAESHSEIDDYWADSSIENLEDVSYDDFEQPQLSSTLHGNENFIDESINENLEIPIIHISPPDETRKNSASKNSQSRKMDIVDEITPKSLVSPRLEYTAEKSFPTSPHLCFFARRESANDSGFVMDDKNQRDPIDKDVDTKKLYKYQMNRPPNLQISRNEDKRKNCNTPISPNKTPIEGRYDTPPGGITLDIHQKKMALVLKRFGLTHFIPTFLEQEVDLDLFLSLNDQDLQEIGIVKKSDRNILLSVVDECNRNPMFM